MNTPVYRAAAAGPAAGLTAPMGARVARGALAVFVAGALLVRAQTNPPSVAQAIELLQDIETRFAGLQSLQYQAERVATVNRQSQAERWQFAYRNPDCLRIDYQAPHARLVVINPDVLWEYVPAAGKALKTDLRSIAPAERQKRLMQVMARVAVEGLHPGAVEPFRVRASKAFPDPADPASWILDGLEPRFRLTLDPARKLMLNSELYDAKGQLTLRTEASEVAQVSPGNWFPGLIRVSHLRDAESVSTETRLTLIKINQPIEDRQFEFTPPARVKVMLPEK